jgi:hypothetical protein
MSSVETWRSRISSRGASWLKVYRFSQVLRQGWDLPATIDPFLQVRGFFPTVVARPWPGRTTVSGSNLAKIRRSMEVMMASKSPPSSLVLPGPPGKERVAREEEVRPLDGEADGAGRVPGGGQGAKAQVTDAEHLVVGQDEVVAGQHAGVRLGHGHRDAGLAHGRNGLNVVPVAVRLHHLARPRGGCRSRAGPRARWRHR